MLFNIIFWVFLWQINDIHENTWAFVPLRAWALRGKWLASRRRPIPSQEETTLKDYQGATKGDAQTFMRSSQAKDEPNWSERQKRTLSVSGLFFIWMTLWMSELFAETVWKVVDLFIVLSLCIFEACALQTCSIPNSALSSQLKMALGERV